MNISTYFSYYSLFTIIGFIWTILALWLMFTLKGKELLSQPPLVLLTGAALAITIWIVMREIHTLTSIAGGLRPLDIQFFYGKVDIMEFGKALGVEGRNNYMAFQLGQDSLAPPAFCCFLMSFYRSFIRSQRVQHICTGLAFVYIFSAFLANNLMPLIIMYFPDDHGFFLTILYSLVPALDAIKYSTNGIAWLLVISTLMFQIIVQSRLDS
jgi:hypothetical protein